MKKNANNLPTILNMPELDEAAAHLIDCLQSFEGEGNFFEIECDLLAFAMPAFLASKEFSELPGERRKDLFNQYAILRSVLNSISKFVSDHPGLSTSNKSRRFNEEAIDLISCLKSFGEVESFFDINYDLMALVMPELCASDTFIDLPGGRRAELFDQFSVLRSVLDLLDRYMSKHSDNLAA